MLLLFHLTHIYLLSLLTKAHEKSIEATFKRKFWDGIVPSTIFFTSWKEFADGDINRSRWVPLLLSCWSFKLHSTNPIDQHLIQNFQPLLAIRAGVIRHHHEHDFHRLVGKEKRWYATRFFQELVVLWRLTAQSINNIIHNSFPCLHVPLCTHRWLLQGFSCSETLLL